MRLLARYELLKLKNGLRNLARSPGRLALSLLMGAFFAFAIGGQFLGLLAPMPEAGRMPFASLLSVNEEWRALAVLAVLLLATYHMIEAGLKGVMVNITH